MTKPRYNISDHILLVVLAFIWGSSFTLIKIIVDALPPLSLTFWRIATAALLLLVVARVRGETLPRDGGAWGWVLLAGLTGNILPFALISWGEERIESGLAAILIAITPITVVVLAHFLTRDERLTWRRVMGVGLGLAGVLVLIGWEALTHLGENLLRQLAVAGAALCYAVNTLVVKRLAGVQPVAMAAAIMLVSSLVLLPAVLAMEGIIIPPPDAAFWAVVLGIVHTGLATLIMFRIVARAGASFFAMINFLIPVIGYGLGVALLGEPPSLRAFLSLGLILAGIALARPVSSARRA